MVIKITANSIENSWFELQQIDKWVYAIRERLDLIEPRFLTKFANSYLIVGKSKAALIDTGIGIHSMKKVVEPLVKNKTILVFNTHHHFDHIGNNYEWSKVYVHRFDLKRVALPEKLDFLETAKGPYAHELLKKGGKTVPADEHYPLIGGELFELGEIDLRIIHTPGHTPGSICVLTSRGHLIAGDTIHNGIVYLPPKEFLPSYAKSLNDLLTNFIQEQDLIVLGGHESTIITNQEVERLNQIIQELQKRIPEEKHEYDTFLNAYVLNQPPFKFVLPK